MSKYKKKIKIKLYIQNSKINLKNSIICYKIIHFYFQILVYCNELLMNCFFFKGLLIIKIFYIIILVLLLKVFFIF